MKKIFTLIAATMMAVGAWADNANFSMATKWGDKSQTVGKITVEFPSTASPQTGFMKFVKGSSFTIKGTQTDIIITAITITATATNYNSKEGAVSVNVGTITHSVDNVATTWAGSANSITIGNGTGDITGGDWRIAAIEVTYTAPETPATEATTWVFTNGLGADDLANVTADGNWGTKTDSEENNYYTWTSTTAIAARNVYVALAANGQDLDITKGLTFARNNSAGLAGGAINFFEDHLNIANSNVLIKIPNLAKNDVVNVRFYSNGTVERGFDPITNTDVTSAMSSDKTDVKDVALTVAADGDVTLNSTASINIKCISINTDLPADQSDDPTGINTIATDAAKAASVKKYIDGKQVVIEKNGKKFNVAGAQIK